MHACVDRLKYFLDNEGVEYNDLLFDGISDLGPNPFVRSTIILRTTMYVLHTLANHSNGGMLESSYLEIWIKGVFSLMGRS